MNITQATTGMTIILVLLQNSQFMFWPHSVRSIQADGKWRKRISPRMMMWVGIKRWSTGAKSSSSLDNMAGREVVTLSCNNAQCAVLSVCTREEKQGREVKKNPGLPLHLAIFSRQADMQAGSRAFIYLYITITVRSHAARRIHHRSSLRTRLHLQSTLPR